MESLINKRQKICESCPLYKIDNRYGPVCDSSRYINPEGTEASYIKKDGWMRGCGCHMKFKWGNIKSKCTIGKW